MRVLDLFSGLGGFSAPFRDRGHEVVTVDIDPRFESDIVADVRKLRFPSLPPLDKSLDVVLASPPCEMFSNARAWHDWPPPADGERDALALVACTLRLILESGARFWVLENPQGRLREHIGPPKQTVHLCDFGSDWKKPTDLWGVYPGELTTPDRCAPHQDALATGRYRKGITAIQTVRDPALRAKLPYGLGEELCKRMEAAI